LTLKQQAALAAFAPVAVAAERASGYPAEVIVAQWAAETGWSLDGVSGDWNLFGLTSAACPARPKKFCGTHEELTPTQFQQLPGEERESVTACVNLGDGRNRYSLSRWFACFDSLADGLEAYVSVITAPGHRYAEVWRQYQRERNLDGLMEGIAGAGYATGSGYGALLKQIAGKETVKAAIAAARAA
jgi:flagellum-specific peptidoglycan hydrolase FlgJ